MRVKYQTRTLSKTFSTNGGTQGEREAFASNIITALFEMGAPLAEDGLNTPTPGMAFLKDTVNQEVISIAIASDSSNNITIGIMGFSMVMQENFFQYLTTTAICPSSSKNANVTIHAVKSGDSFFFGFLPHDANPSDACINYAITPMRKLSDPSVSLGYAFLVGTTPPVNSSFAMLYRTLPCIDGFNYNNGMCNMVPADYVFKYPEVETGKIPLIPYYAGIEDIYYDRVYVSPMCRGTTEEKAFETDKGVFLISGETGIDWERCFCMLAFDITEAVNSAQ
jgi:hypothetical protein